MTKEFNETGARILSELEEAGEEELVTLINTVMSRHEEANDLDTFASAISDLISSGDVVIERRSRGKPFEQLSLRGEAHQAVSTIAFDPVEGYWIDTAKAFDVYAIASPAGLERARRILDERGYQWWMQRT